MTSTIEKYITFLLHIFPKFPYSFFGCFFLSFLRQMKLLRNLHLFPNVLLKAVKTVPKQQNKTKKKIKKENKSQSQKPIPQISIGISKVNKPNAQASTTIQSLRIIFKIRKVKSPSKTQSLSHTAFTLTHTFPSTCFKYLNPPNPIFISPQQQQQLLLLLLL